jgi:glycosyltransferase involved in cell wall biosynthesis
VEARIGPSPAVVGIGLLTLVPGQIGGSETYVHELLRALARVGELEYRVFLPSIAADAGGGLPATVVRSYPARTSMTGRAAAMTRAALLPGAIRRELAPGRLDAVHFPLTAMLPPLAAPPAATTVHDLAHELFPGLLPRTEVAWRRFAWRRVLRRCRIAIAISDTVKESLVERYGMEPERIRVVHHGVDRTRFRPGDGPREPFLLYPAHAWPNKNHDRLIEAFELLRRERPELGLVLTGGGHEGRRVPAGVELRGRVPSDELVRLYQMASALVFPSLYEGFGQPPLEAMACGCPVAAAPTGAIPEVCGDAARYFDPLSAESIAEAVADVLAHPDELVARGLERAAGFSWEECARKHEAVYRELAAGRER